MGSGWIPYDGGSPADEEVTSGNIAVFPVPLGPEVDSVPIQQEPEEIPILNGEPFFVDIYPTEE